MPQVTCPSCRTALAIPDQSPVLSFRCPRCQTILRLKQRPRPSDPKPAVLAEATAEMPTSQNEPRSEAIKPAESKIPFLIGVSGCLGLLLLFGTAAIGVGYIFTRKQPEKPTAVVAPSDEERKEESSTLPQPVVPPHPPAANAIGPQPKEELPQEPLVKVSVVTLDAEYSKNLVTADLKYRDKQVELSGIVDEVDKDEQGRYFIGTGSSRLVKSQDSSPRMTSVAGIRQRIQEAVLNEQYVPGVILYIKPTDLKGFTGLDATKPFTIRGRCRGSQKDPTTVPDRYVIVEDCIFVGGQSATPLQPHSAASSTTTSVQPSPTFSETDVEASAAWLTAVVEKAKGPQHNAIAAKQKHEALRKTLDDLKGKRITWIMRIQKVDFHTMSFMNIMAGVVANAADTEASVKRVRGFRHSGDKWIGNLKQGSKVKLTGVIEGIHIRYSRWVEIEITIKDYAILPVE